MGLREDIQLAVLEAFDGDLSDVVTVFDLVKITQGAYNPVLGERVETETKTFTKGVFASFGTNEIDETNIKSTDEKIIVNGKNLSIDPDPDDRVQLANGSEFIVITVRKIMGGDTEPVIYILQVRKNG